MVDFTLNAQQLTTIFKILNKGRTGCILNFNENGIDVKDVSSCNTWLTHIYIPKTSMKCYDYDKVDSNKHMVIDANEMISILKPRLLSFGDLVTISDNGKLQCGIVQHKLETYNSDITNAPNEPRIPELKMSPAKFKININTLYNALCICGDKSLFEYMDNAFHISDKENTIIDIQKVIEVIDVDLPDNPRKTLITNSISMSFLKILKTCVLDTTVTFGHDYPVTYECVDKWGTEYMIMQAHRIEPE